MADPIAPSPELQSLFSGVDLSALAGTSQTTSTSDTDLAKALLQSAYATSAPYGSTLPWWVQSLSSSVLSQNKFDDVNRASAMSDTVASDVGGLVYIGTSQRDLPASPPERGGPGAMIGPTGPLPDGGQKSSDYAVTATQAANLPYSWDEKEVADAMQRLRDAGLQVDSFDMGSNSLVSVWGALVNRAALTYAASDGKTKVTPWDVLDLYKQESKAGNLGGFSGSKSFTQRNVTDITEGQAFSSLQGTLSSLLGRDPSDQETRDFLYRMNRLAAENPTISRTVTKYKNGEAVSSSTHTNPGFTADDMAQQAYDQAQNEPDYAEYRGASYLFNAAMQALGPIGG